MKKIFTVFFVIAVSGLSAITILPPSGSSPETIYQYNMMNNANYQTELMRQQVEIQRQNMLRQQQQVLINNMYLGR